MPILKAKYNGEWIKVGAVGGGTGSGSEIGTTVSADWNQFSPSSADYVKNRTHFTRFKKNEFSIKALTFDGNIEGLETVANAVGGYYVRLSEDTPSPEYFYNMTLTYTLASGETESFTIKDSHLATDIYTLSQKDSSEQAEGWTGFSDLLLILDTNMQLGSIALGPGLWIYYKENSKYISSLTYLYGEEDIRPLHQKYIPASIARTADVITSPASAAIGQTLVVKAVDSNGKPTQWETANAGMYWDSFENYQ